MKQKLSLAYLFPIIPVFSIFSILLNLTETYATTGINQLFVEKYPATQEGALNNCRTCHSPMVASSLNQYGLDLKGAKLDFAAIEQLDSDGDTKINIDEINALTLPGSQATMPEQFTFTNNKGAVNFNHLSHSVNPLYLSKGECQRCHVEGGLPKLFNDSVSIKEIAHELCRGCHKESQSTNAPQKCNQCHIL